MTIDIVIPFYGDPSLLEESILSVIRQSNQNWTLTIIDDAYPGHVAEPVVSRFPDPRITFIRNEYNQGVSGTFQQALSIGNSAYLVILGFDDRLLPHYVDRVQNIIKNNPDVTYIQPGVTIIDDIGNEYLPLVDRIKRNLIRKLRLPGLLRGDELASSLLKGNWTYFPSICWNRKQILRQGFRQDMQIVLDLSLQLNLICDGGTMFLDEVPVFEYRRHRLSASSWTARDGSRFKEEKQLFREIADKTQELGWNKSRRAANIHITSRLNAINQLPQALFALNFSAISTLAKHAFGP